jgi:CPA2 family monovalent cation:H+ antiporter-2
MYISHLRSEGNALLPAVDELIRIAREARVPAEIYHLKAAGEENWAKMDTVIARVEAARAEGHLDATAGREGVEQPVRFPFAFGLERDVVVVSGRERVAQGLESVGAHQDRVLSQRQRDVRYLVLVALRDAHGVVSEVAEADHPQKVAAEHGPVEAERFFGVSREVEVRVHRLHDRLPCGVRTFIVPPVVGRKAARSTRDRRAAIPDARTSGREEGMNRRAIDTERTVELRTAAGASVCSHIEEVRSVRPGTPGCEECLRMGDTWVHLRVCMSCGHVGCCDSSRNRHATKHHGQTRHPIVRSLEPGEEWGWCYVDEVLV